MKPKDLGLEAELAPVGRGWRVYLYYPAGDISPQRIATVHLNVEPQQRTVKVLHRIGIGQDELLAVAEEAVRGFLAAVRMAKANGFSFDERDQ